jgi:hypothetical protein
MVGPGDRAAIPGLADALKVYFFGGYLSTHDDVVSWKRSVELVSGVSATVWHYPEGASAGDPLAVWDSSTAVARMMLAAGGPALVVSHSSGVCIANDVAMKARGLGFVDFSFVALDGGPVSGVLLGLSSTQLWSAVGGNGAHSLNYGAMRSYADHVGKSGAQFHIYWAGGVSMRWPIHFSLVNTNASDAASGITDGYRDCAANLTVLGLGA